MDGSWYYSGMLPPSTKLHITDSEAEKLLEWIGGRIGIADDERVVGVFKGNKLTGFSVESK